MASQKRDRLVNRHNLSDLFDELKCCVEFIKDNTLHLKLRWGDGKDLNCLTAACCLGDEDFRILVGIFKQLYEVKEVVLYNELGSACCLKDVKIEGLRWEKSENFPK